MGISKRDKYELEAIRFIVARRDCFGDFFRTYLQMNIKSNDLLVLFNNPYAKMESRGNSLPRCVQSIKTLLRTTLGNDWFYYLKDSNSELRLHNILMYQPYVEDDTIVSESNLVMVLERCSRLKAGYFVYMRLSQQDAQSLYEQGRV